MKTRVAYGLITVAFCALLAACGRLDFFGQEREPWRDAEEARCLRAGALQPTAFTEPMSSIRQKGVCGLEHPFKVAALAQGQVSISPPAKLGCPMNWALNKWLHETVQPAAYANYGQPVVGLRNIASYGCRTRNNKPGAKLSEHAFGNALDIKAFHLADGRTIDIRSSWHRGPPHDQAFLRQVISGACGTFKTVLGPGSDGYHEDHFHLDLARHASGRAVCNPRPQAVPPVYHPPSAYPPNVPMSYAAEPQHPHAAVPTPYAAPVR